MPSVLDMPLPSVSQSVTPPKAVTRRKFGDAAATRKLLFDNVRDAAGAYAPVSNNVYTLNLTDVDYIDPDRYSLAARKRAILERQSMNRRLQGTWRLVNNETGEEVAKRRAVLARVPYMTDDGTFVHNGNEWTMSHQKRLLPGVFTRRKENGELEAHVNVSKGLGHKIFMDPESGVFRVQIAQARIPLLPLLNTMGVPDSDIRKAWGNELYAANVAKTDPQAINKFYARVAKYGEAVTDLDKKAGVADAFRKMELSPEVTKRTMGEAFTNVDEKTLMAITQKLLRVNRGEEESDDRDHMAFQTFVGPEDIFAEKFKRARHVARNLLWKATARHNLNHVTADMYGRELSDALTTSGLGMPLEEINPADVFDQQSRITSMGEGGIPSLDAVPDEARAVQPSQLGFVDFLRTPESSKVGVDLRLARNVEKGSDGRLYMSVVDNKTGQSVWKSAQDIADVAMAFPGEMRRDGSYAYALEGGRMKAVPKNRIAYSMAHMEDAFSPLGNMIPMKSTVKGQRAVMAARMLTQALPLVDPEAPLVQGGIPDADDESYEERYADKLGRRSSPVQGIVTDISGGGITVRDAQGEDHSVELYENFPFNRKTFIHNTPTVAPGDRVAEGDLLATSNFTDGKGVTALGKNARVAYIPWKGYNFEDAIVVSKGFADRMKSEHMYQHSIDFDPKLKVSKNAFISSFAAKYPRKLLDNFTADGVIKPGTTVEYGDPLLLAVKERERTRRVLKGRSALFKDASVTWEHHSPGVVTDIANTKDGSVVVVKASSSLEEGDKLSGRYGDKGVISAIVPDEDMIVGADGKPYEVLLNPAGLTSRTNAAQIIEAGLGKIAAITGKPYKVKDFGSIEDATEYALAELRKHGLSDLESVTDPETKRKINDIMTGNRWFMKLHHTAEAKGQGRGLGAYTMDEAPARGGPEGCFTAKQKIDTIRGPITIAKICEGRLGVQVRTFSEALQEWVYRPVTDWFVYRARVTDLITIETNGGPCTRESRVNRTRSCVYVTPQHEFVLLDNSRKLARDIRPGDQLTTWGLMPTAHQLAFLYGTLLGDASINDNALLIEHSIKQRNHVDWKQKVLAGLCPQMCDTTHTGGINSLPSLRGKTHRARQLRVIEDHVVHELRRVCYSGDNGEKRITAEWLAKLTGFSAVAWMLDDGSITNKAKKKGKLSLAGKFATHGFSRGDRERLVDWLKQWSGETCSTADEGSITISAKMCRRIISEVAKWVPYTVIPKSKKVLRRLVADIQKTRPPHCINATSRLAKVALRVCDVRPYKHDKSGIDEINVYDFTVADTRTYVAGHALVSNSKRIGMMELGALLSHGATDVIRDATLVRGQANPEYWSMFMSGHKPPTPKVPRVYEKFVNQLKASGINVVREGTMTNIMALTNKDIDTLAGNREIKNAETVNWKDMSPVKGGLFDETLTGGHDGRRWSYIKLQEPLPNPVMEEPIRRILGMTKKRFEDVIGCQEELNGACGPRAIQRALESIDLGKEMERARAEIKSGKRTARDAAVRRLGYLKSANRLNIHPKDWMVDKVPVLPPAFRTVSVMGQKKLPLVDDANYLYKEVFDANRNLRDVGAELDDDVGDERLTLYRTFRAVTGLGDPVHPKNRERKVKGILKHVFGSSPKIGTVQRKLLGSAVDLVGRAVITPDPDLDMDHVGLPEDKAWEIYKPVIVRNLARKGMQGRAALRAVEERQPLAREALVKEMESRPILINRAPTLHKFGFLAAYPRLTTGNTLKISPLIVGGFGADFDGDAMNYHLLADDKAAQEAIEKMLPSQNLLNPADFKVLHTPTQEYIAGLYEASARVDEQNKPMVFETTADAVRAYRRGQINIDRRVEIINP